MMSRKSQVGICYADAVIQLLIPKSFQAALLIKLFSILPNTTIS